MFATHIKPTNLGHYIASDSYHSSSTLTNWATAELQRYARNSTCWHEAIAPVERLFNCLEGRLYQKSLQDMVAMTWQKWRQRQLLLHPAQHVRKRYTTLYYLFTGAGSGWVYSVCCISWNTSLMRRKSASIHSGLRSRILTHICM